MSHTPPVDSNGAGKGKQRIASTIQTFTIPFMAFEPINPDSDTVSKTMSYFNSHFANADDFELDKIENTYWVIIDGEWYELGNNIIFRRKANK